MTESSARPAVTLAWILAAVLVWRAPDVATAVANGLLATANWVLTSTPGVAVLAVGLVVTIAYLLATPGRARYARGW